ncbi:unnamed protein product [Allacma fusca]|uniref:Dysbindin n=1 Tax=Allacma fusca TaxID=39272 RepID=A0A8J2NU05_9HEXA|nr:unnamed protein product [Allacma fusca]
MFSSLKEKFLNVQEEITTSLKNLKFDRHLPGSFKSNKPELNDVNYDAGVELLERYQNYWSDLHKRTEITAACAYEVDDLITKLHQNYDSQCKKVGQLSNSLANIPQLIHGVQEVCDLILNVQCQMDETNESLEALQDIVDTQELREKQLDHRFQLALYQERRLNELEGLKVKLMEEHLEKVKHFEQRQVSRLKERQAVFQEAFEEDLQHFKLQGSIPKVTGVAETSPTLEEIELEEDPFVLETFLADQEQKKISSNP